MAIFTWTPQLVYSYSPGYRTLISTFESGKEQWRQKWSVPRRRFHLVWNAISKSDADAIRAFFEARKGAYESFTFQNPADSISYTVRFIEDSLTQEFITPTICRLECDFIEVI